MADTTPVAPGEQASPEGPPVDGYSLLVLRQMLLEKGFKDLTLLGQGVGGHDRYNARGSTSAYVRTYPGRVGFDPGSEHTHGEYVGPENTPNQASSKQRLIRPGWHKVGGLPRIVRCCLQRRVARRQTMCGEGGQVSVAKHVARTLGPLHAVRYVRAMFVSPGTWTRWTRT